MWRMSRNQSSQTTVQTTNQTADDKYRQMTEAPVERLVLTLAGPAILANLVTAIYNICDTYFVGQLGTSAEGAASAWGKAPAMPSRARSAARTASWPASTPTWASPARSSLAS